MSGWSEERVDRLKALWKEGLSANQIANDLGWTTRNAVISKIHRLGLAERGPGFHHPNKITRTKTQTLADNRLKMRAKREPVDEAAPIPFVERTLAGAPAPKMLSLFELTARTCRFPIGDPCDASFGFCGHLAEFERPYCRHHQLISRQAPMPRRRAA